MNSAVDPTLVERFRRDVVAVLGRDVEPVERFALAVSGGPDSMAMLALAAAAFPGQVIAATVDHGLRPASADEAAMVARWCGEAGIDHSTLRVTAPRGSRDNLHSWAREERYALLERWAIDHGAHALLTAHHADDQAETFLMRAARGSGLTGLSAIRAMRPFAVSPTSTGDEEQPPLVLLRPLLGWRRAELRAVVDQAGLPCVDDPSNADDRFERTRFRAWLAQAPWLDVIGIGRAAGFLAETEADLAALGALLAEQRALPSGAAETRFDVAGLPREMRRRLARRAIESVLTATAADRGNWNAASNIEPLLDALDAGGSATQGPVFASAKGDIWHFSLAPPRRSL